jgi:hypothetical protein
MNELLMIAVMAWGGVCFALGGTEMPWTGNGYKWIRRQVMPLGFAVLAYFLGLVWWKCLIFLLLSMFLRAGYGDSSPYWKKILVFIAYGLPSLVIGFSWWVVITPVVLTLLFVASNWKPLATTVFWKAWEFLAGVLVSLCFIGAFLNRW